MFVFVFLVFNYIELFDICCRRGLSRRICISLPLSLHKTGIAGTPLYMAPEVATLPHNNHQNSKPQATHPNIETTKVDVYAAALVLWFLLYRRHPLGEYAGQGRHELTAKVRNERGALFCL